MSRHLTTRIEEALGVAVTGHGHLGVGFGLTGLRADLCDGREIAVKAGRTKQPGHLQLEAFMLRELKDKSRLPVPEVYHADDELLVMEWIGNDGGGISRSAEQHAAELLAELHLQPEQSFGYERDTVIGPLHQPNPVSNAWIPFYRNHRLLHMAEHARIEGSLPGKYFSRLEKLASRLDEFLTEPAHPSLLHGDLWTGNVLVNKGRIAGFIDPAIYCGHPEVELAFTTMFGTFGAAFFDAYESLAPLEPGFHDVRRNIYLLYPTLVHIRLFGDGYLPPIDRTLSRLGF